MTIILIQALLEARYRGDEQHARQFLFFIAICCGTSTFANLAISLNDFDPHIFLPHAPAWVQAASPYALASFPLFVIMMSIAAEMIINVRPLESLNEDEYEADEKKRLKILEIRNTYLLLQVDEELRALTIHAQMRANTQLRKGQWAKSFRWPWEKPLEIDAVIAGVTTQLKAVYEPQIQGLKQQVNDLLKQVNDAQNQQSNILIEDDRPTEKTTVNQDAKEADSTGQSAFQKTVLQADLRQEKLPAKARQKAPEWHSHPALSEVVKASPKIEAWRSRGQVTVSIEDIMRSHQSVTKNGAKTHQRWHLTDRSTQCRFGPDSLNYRLVKNRSTTREK